MALRDKKKRSECFASRDLYWQCLDGLDNRESRLRGQEQEGQLKPCMEMRRLCQDFCSDSLMRHFDRKRHYTLFREKVAMVGRMDIEPPSISDPECTGHTAPKHRDIEISPIPAIKIAKIEDDSISGSRYEGSNGPNSNNSYLCSTFGNVEQFRSISDRLSSLLQIPRTNESYSSSLLDSFNSNEDKLKQDNTLLKHSVSHFSILNPNMSSGIDSSVNEIAILKSKSMNSIPDNAAMRRRRKYSEIVSSQRLIPSS